MESGLASPQDFGGAANFGIVGLVLAALAVLVYAFARNRSAARLARAGAAAGVLLFAGTGLNWPAIIIVLAALAGGAIAAWAPIPAQRQSMRAAPPPTPAQPAQAPAPTQSIAPPDVFISYKREERAGVAAIAQRLNALKLSVWFDARMQSGAAFDEEINRAVRGAKCVLVCWSPGAVESVWVRAEADIGRTRGVLAAAILSSCDLFPPFNLIHTDDLRAGVGPQNPEWLKLLERIGALVGRPGLAAYENAHDRAALGAWIAAYPNDPLADDAVARLRALA
ncbi:MAG: TIR domain-containing protein [Alphaproteobacteria bacterium]|nr:TIR domain-containing protein [Alphaproteobacteria bacterium]